MITRRDPKRYGRFSADCLELGKVTVETCPNGFGETIEIIKDGKVVESVDTNDRDAVLKYDEDDDMLTIGEYRVEKPFRRCVRRYSY